MVFSDPWGWLGTFTSGSNGGGSGFSRGAFTARSLCGLIRNAGLLVTGALVATENRFAQVLEGPNANVDTLMVSILRDPRHTAINVIRDTPIRRRTFPKWSLAYVGPSTYVQGLIQPMLAEPFTTAQTDKLVRLMREFAREGG